MPARIDMRGPVPRHVAVIMDGNGRWARRQGLPRKSGHEAGMSAVRTTIEASVDAGVEILTLFAFSTDNWNRPSEEVSALMSLLKAYAEQECSELVEKGVEVHVLGTLTRMQASARAAVERIMRETEGGTTLRLNLMISYSGREDILTAVRRLAARVEAGELEPGEIDEACLERALLTSGIPDPDLLIRTSGECRISNFMLWQISYSEIHITPVLWPDFSRDDFLAAVLDYQRRDRRFGRITSA